MTRGDIDNIIKVICPNNEDFEKPCISPTYLKNELEALALEQEPCEMTAEEYRQRMIQAFHNADTDELIAICVLPTEKEFEHLEWLLKNHYKKESCGNAIDRAEAIRIASGYCHPANVAKELAKLPAVNLQPCEDAISRQAAIKAITNTSGIRGDALNALYDLPPVNPQPKIGHWIEKDGFDGDTYYDCSECGESWTTIVGTPWDNGMAYCPDCGGKMIEPQESE